jgi:hypothetical protein
MTLAADDRRALSRIEGALRRSDPKLAAMLATFNRLNQAERMPARERLRAPRLRWSPRLWWSARTGSRVRRRLFAPLPPRSSAPGSSGSRSSARGSSGSRSSGPGSSGSRSSAPGPASLSRWPWSGRRFRAPRPGQPAVTPAGAAQSGAAQPGRPIAALRGRPSRFAQIVPVIMATCALGLMVVMFTVLAHARPAPQVQARGARCVPTVIMSCQPASGSAGTTVSRPGGAG